MIVSDGDGGGAVLSRPGGINRDHGGAHRVMELLQEVTREILESLSKLVYVLR